MSLINQTNEEYYAGEKMFAVTAAPQTVFTGASLTVANENCALTQLTDVLTYGSDLLPVRCGPIAVVR